VRWTTVVAFALLAVACNDLRDFRGTWSGSRVGDADVVRVGVDSGARASLVVEDIFQHGFAGTLTITGLADAASVVSVDGAEADVLAGITFPGSPLRTYLSFVPTTDGGGDALVIIALYDHDRIELRVLRGGTTPLYGIFSLTEGAL
jgi:hypothetical protein